MRKLFLLFMLVPLLGIGQAKNVINTFRVFPKIDKLSEFEKALATHAQKFHTGDWKWRVYSIETGPDAGGFHIIEGPLSWEQFDKRGEISTEHTADWNKNVAPLTSSMGTTGYSIFNAELSNVEIGAYADKIIINHVYPKPGMVVGVTDLIKKMKKVWIAGNENMAVYNVGVSGPPQIVIVTRLKDGLKELDSSYRKPFAQRYNAVFGEDAWNYYLADYAKCVESRWAEMLFIRPDLGSK